MPPVHFLLVDDLEENLLSLEALLRRENLVLLKARSGDEALELLLRHDVALALVDVQMPGLNGFELAELMRGNERTRHIPIIFVTAGTADGQRRFRGYEAGAVDFIQKPIETDILRSKADVFFQLYRQRQQIAAQRDELEAQAEALKEAGRRKDEFLLTLTHDLTLHKDARAQQDVLLREINHRIKNLFSLTSGLISLSAKNARSVEELSADLRSRLKALADAHALTLPDLRQNQLAGSSTTVAALLEAILSPHEFEQAPRITITGSDAALSGKALTSFALLVHELATNAAKYGALSTPEGRLAVEISVTRDETLRVCWEEQAAAHAIVNQDRDREGFGTALEKAVLVGLDGSISRDWREEGLSLTIEMPLARLVP
ncbi:histidine kinase [Mesorhizobium hungaricum]|jgi:two-component sensor histidine kinase|uniref:histidine kinase n=2 Tax=Phyllobacteriaceae TaxID=69277 RepID=A0A1C2E743_9HYPH|nr:response regulator [Mesorhizobium terrae]MBN9237442.1 response regulator [Mesorhizobium sp.]OCX22743.1 histidine kinase [Mesorhizobium hungaricum]